MKRFTVKVYGAWGSQDCRCKVCLGSRGLGSLLKEFPAIFNTARIPIRRHTKADTSNCQMFSEVQGNGSILVVIWNPEGREW